IIIAARPSMGKTAFALNIAQYAAIKKGARVVIFSLEMSKEQLGIRFLSQEARINSKDLRMGNLTEENWADLNEAVGRISGADIIIDDTSDIGVMEIRNKCRRIDAQKKIDLIIIDYLQIMSADTASESRVQEVTMMTRYLKQLARELKCPVVVLSQLSRASEKRQGGHKPMLSDLRESGAIEQDADVVMFLHREDYYKDADAEKSNVCEVIIAKQRTGATGSVYLTWLPNYTKFADREPEKKS
ncbi:MAG: DnaB-like helicase C-terminal domain-containing protein, partial [Firmicutes bacterium]|nr:DnaB-like helicase C-terminal domain-containing protein [Bacillota bacterium]